MTTTKARTKTTKAARAALVRNAAQSACKRGPRHEATFAKRLSAGGRAARWAAKRSRGLDGDVLDALAEELIGVVVDTVWHDIKGGDDLRSAVLREVAEYLLDIANRKDGKHRKAA